MNSSTTFKAIKLLVVYWLWVGSASLAIGVYLTLNKLFSGQSDATSVADLFAQIPEVPLWAYIVVIIVGIIGIWRGVHLLQKGYGTQTATEIKNILYVFIGIQTLFFLYSLKNGIKDSGYAFVQIILNYYALKYFFGKSVGVTSQKSPEVMEAEKKVQIEKVEREFKWAKIGLVGMTIVEIYFLYVVIEMFRTGSAGAGFAVIIFIFVTLGYCEGLIHFGYKRNERNSLK